MPATEKTPGLRRAMRALLAAAMIAVGVLHFVQPEPFARIVPRALPSALALVYLSGLFEVLGGLGLLVPRTRRAAGWGLVALYIAVFPANVNMAVNNIQPPDGHIPVALLWARLPLQAALIAVALWVSRADGPRDPARQLPPAAPVA